MTEIQGAMQASDPKWQFLEDVFLSLGYNSATSESRGAQFRWLPGEEEVYGSGKRRS